MCIISFVICTFGVLSKKALSKRSGTFTPVFLFRTSYTLVCNPFLVKYHVWSGEGAQLHSFLCRYPIVPGLFVEKNIFPFIELSWHSCEKSIDHRYME